MNRELKERWKPFYEKTLGSAPNVTLIKAIEHLNPLFNDKFAIDLGCGSGRDTLLLLKEGWSVLAVDKCELAFDYLLKETRSNKFEKKLKTLISCFEELDFSQYPEADLINASYSLPFCLPQYFFPLWKKIISRLKNGGIFCGQLFGNNHSWAKNKYMAFQYASHIPELFEGFDMMHFEEEDRDGTDIEGNLVHWHVFHVVARKSAVFK